MKESKNFVFLIILHPCFPSRPSLFKNRMKTKQLILFISFVIAFAATSAEAGAQTLQDLLGNDEDVYRPEPETCAGSPRAGAREVKVVVRSNDDVLLVGLNGNRVAWQKKFPLKEEVNTPKTTPTCTGRRIELYSQAPFSAAASIQTFAWDGTTLRHVSTKYEDPSAEFIERAIRAAESGDKRKLDALYGDEEGDIEILYPGHYISGALLAEAIKRGHTAANAVYKTGKPREAAARLALMFDLTVDFSTLASGDVSATTPLEKWLEAWKAQEMETPDYVPALNDYGFFLQQSGDDRAAVAVFKAIVERAPARAVAHLNLADSLWTLNQKAEAATHYRRYRQLMSAENKTDKIPPRVVERTKE